MNDSPSLPQIAKRVKKSPIKIEIQKPEKIRIRKFEKKSIFEFFEDKYNKYSLDDT